MQFFYIPWPVILLIIGVFLCVGYLAVQEVIALLPILLLLLLAFFSHYSRKYLLSVFLEYGILCGIIHAVIVFSVRAIACYIPFIVYEIKGSYAWAVFSAFLMLLVFYFVSLMLGRIPEREEDQEAVNLGALIATLFTLSIEFTAFMYWFSFVILPEFQQFFE